LLFRQSDQTVVEPPVRSPFELGPLLLFAFLFAMVATINAALAGHIGRQGLVATSAISGAIDVDVAALSALRLIGTSATTTSAGAAVLAAIAVNALLRVALAAASGQPRFWMPFLLATAAAGVLGGIAFFLLPAL
jgi:uncharacterized membrane protein (DUF4010 family)